MSTEKYIQLARKAFPCLNSSTCMLISVTENKSTVSLKVTTQASLSNVKRAKFLKVYIFRTDRQTLGPSISCFTPQVPTNCQASLWPPTWTAGTRHLNHHLLPPTMDQEQRREDLNKHSVNMLWALRVVV